MYQCSLDKAAKSGIAQTDPRRIESEEGVS